MKIIELTSKIGTNLSEEEIISQGSRALGISPKNFGGYQIIKRSIDARKDVIYRYRVEVYGKGETPEKYEVAPYQDVHNSRPVIVIGAGPAGMFAALKLLQKGLKPVVLERGKSIKDRAFDIAALSTKGILNPDSNYCFGEGGAGTYSDGKLYTRSSKRGDIREVLHQLVAFGAEPSILVDAHPHIGSDHLGPIVTAIRECIEAHGGEYHFSAKVVDIVPQTGGSYKVTTASGDMYEGAKVILAAGHSSKEMYELFKSKGWALQAKGFALGVRVEHPQSLINKIQYHGKYQPFMPTAEYSFVTQIEGRGVFSFCMCPGGILVPSATEPETQVLNGMSNSRRNSKWANAGVVVSVEPEDYPEYMAKYGELGLLEFQQSVESAMYRYSGSIKAPAQRMMDFCRGIETPNLPETSYHPGAVSAPLNTLLPEGIALRLKYAFPQIGNNLIKGYYTNDALLLGVESRTSSPVRMPRDPETLEHISAPGLYPAGEGAGYSGGIVSSALDGIACAEKAAQSLL